MQITLNNRSETIDRNEISVEQLIELKNFTFKMLVVKINKRLIQKGDYSDTIIKDGDDVTVLHLVSGG